MILITGGLGYIGCHVNKELDKRGFETVVVDNLVYGHREFARWGTFELCDLSDLEAMKKIFKQYPTEAVMHFAGFTYVGESMDDPQKYYYNNVVNTLNLLNLMMENDVSYFIFSSSCAVYGVPEKVPIPEDHPRNPINPYGKTKLAVENILEDYGRAYDLKYASLRYFNAAGADPDCEIGEWHEPETHLIPIVLEAALGKRDCVEVYGTDYPTYDGTCIRDYIHVTDLADVHILALKHLMDHGQSDVFNLGNGNGFSVKEVINKAREVTGVDIKAVDSQRRAGDPPILVAGSERAKEVLGWEPRYDSLDTILATAWEWSRELYRKYK